MAIDMTNTSGTTKRRPCGKGRRKVEIKKIESASSRMVAFSKRKKGLFNKAAELHRLSGSDIAIIIFSSAGRPFTFGKPSADHVIDRFLRDDSGEEEEEMASCSEETKDKECDMQILQPGEDEDEDEDEEEEKEEGFWWEESIEGFSLEEIEMYKASLEVLRNNTAMRLEEIMMRRDYERNFLSFI